MKLSSAILFLNLAAISLCSCNDNDQYQGELYEKVIYVLSDDDYAFSSTHAFGQTSTGYVTIYCGGTEHIDHNVIVEMEYDDDALDAYNKMYFDIDESRFARELKPSQFKIPSYTTVLFADSPDYYSLLPIEVNPEGLSPDSIYMIPLKIKNISDFRTNPKKEKVLYRVILKNDFASMENTTFYRMTGVESINLSSGEVSSGVSVTRIFAPLSKDQVRFFAGTHTYTPSGLTKELLDKFAVIATLNEDHTVTLSSYGNIIIEQLTDDPEFNKWTLTSSENGTGGIMIRLNYRFKDDVTFNNSTENCWVTMKETNLYYNSTATH